MARVQPIEFAKATPEVRALYQALGNPARALNVTKTIANHPDFLAGFVAIVRGLYQHNVLAPRLRELAYLRSSQINQCHY